jgi:DNA modification methylase
MNGYTDFLLQKQKAIVESGFEVSEDELNPLLFNFQKFTVKRALKAGKYAIFADTGQGKTPMQLEIAKQVMIKTHKSVLILAPLAVTTQTIEQGAKFGIKVRKWKDTPRLGIYITNYEQIDNIDESKFSCICLDESSILKNETGKYRNKLIEKFKKTPYKFCFSATPSPNDPMELGNHSEFLDVMSYKEMLAMYFIHDAGNTQQWRLKGHAVDRFYEFVSTWAIMYSHPRDIGFEIDGYDLPELKIIEKQVCTPIPENQLLAGMAVNATDYNSSLRLTEKQRIDQTCKIIAKIGFEEPIIIWTKQNQEAINLYKNLTELGHDCRNVQGSDNNEKKERDLIGFAQGEYQILITKQSIASQGLNFQNCCYQIFNSVDFSFEQSYQAIRRSWRFGQHRKVICYMITTDRMINIIQIQKEKQQSFKNMQEKMTKAVNRNLNHQITEQVSYTKDDIKSDNFWVMRGDCVQRSKEIPDKEAGLIIFSPPFAELYTYSAHVEDMGNSKNYDEFAKHFQYLIPELKRILQPGRIVAVHCMDLPIQKGKEGYIGLRDFSGMLIKWFQKSGFIYHARTTIWKDPVVEMQRTKALGLLHKQVKKDSVMSRVGNPDYILFFRNEGENEVPIKNTEIPVTLWQKIASPVWYDINYSRTLNYRAGKTNEDEKHICPLQLDTIERVILLYSNEGDVIFSPFGGIGSEGYQALKMNRKSISIELKESYFELNKRNHISAAKNNERLPLEFI